jgi:hypothetical protein
MSRPRPANVFAALGFAAVIGAPALLQTGWELRRGERPQALALFRRAPTAKNLRLFESDLEESSLTVKELRPWVQFAQFEYLADAGEKGVVGRDGWLFYRPGLQYLTERPASTAGANADPLPAIISFRDQLAARGIALLVMIAPNKESIYPEMLVRREDDAGVFVCPETRRLIERLQECGVGVVNLFDVFGEAKRRNGANDTRRLYLAQDSHWSPEGVRFAAAAAADRVRSAGSVRPGGVVYDERPAPVRRAGDVLQMLHAPPLERSVSPEEVLCVQVVNREKGALYRDDPAAEVLALGDSFLRIFERDEPRAAGFVAHLARELRQPLASLVSDGGASTVVRQELARRPRLLAKKKLVIWEFVERDIRFGEEGWQVVPLPPG